MATFGKTVLGQTAQGFGWQGVYVCRFMAPEDGVITKLTIYSYYPDRFMPVIYADAVGMPSTLLAIGAEVVQTERDVWVDLPISLQVEAGKAYHLGFYSYESFWTSVDLGESTQLNQDGIDNYPNANNPFGTPLRSWDLEMPIYATYTPLEPGPLQIFITPQSVTLTVNQQQTFVATITGGVYPYTVSWIDGATNNVLGQGTSLTVSFASVGDYVIFARAVDAENTTVDSQDIQITVTEPPPPPPTHQLTVDSTPIQGVPFTIEEMV